MAIVLVVIVYGIGAVTSAFIVLAHFLLCLVSLVAPPLLRHSRMCGNKYRHGYVNMYICLKINSHLHMTCRLFTVLTTGIRAQCSLTFLRFLSFLHMFMHV